MKKTIYFIIVMLICSLTTSYASFSIPNEYASNGTYVDYYSTPHSQDIGGVGSMLQLKADTYISSTYRTSAKAYIDVQTQYNTHRGLTIESIEVGETRKIEYWDLEPAWTILWGVALYTYTGTSARCSMAVSW